MKNRFINFWNVYKPLVITFGLILLFAVVLALTCVGVATMDTSSKLAHADDTWVTADNSNYNVSVAPLTQSTTSNCGLYYNLSNSMINGGGLDKFLDYFINPYQETTSVINYFQTIGYLYGRRNTLTTYLPNTVTFERVNESSTDYVVAIGLRAQYGLSNGVTTLRTFDICSAVTSYNSSGNIVMSGISSDLYVSSRVVDQLSNAEDWRIVNNHYVLNSYVIPIRRLGSWYQYNTTVRNIGNGLAYQSPIQYLGYVTEYSSLPDNYKSLIAPCFNGFGDVNGVSSHPELVNELRVFLSNYMGFGTISQVNVGGAYDSGYQAGYADAQNSLESSTNNEIVQLEGQITSLQNQLEAQANSFNQSLTAKYDEGYRSGKAVGYSQGYLEGVDSGGQYTFLNLMGSVVDAPIQAFMGLLNFDVLGVNMSSFVLSLLSLSFIIIIIKICLGGA